MDPSDAFGVAVGWYTESVCMDTSDENETSSSFNALGYCALNPLICPDGQVCGPENCSLEDDDFCVIGYLIKIQHVILYLVLVIIPHILLLIIILCTTMERKRIWCYWFKDCAGTVGCQDIGGYGLHQMNIIKKIGWIIYRLH